MSRSSFKFHTFFDEGDVNNVSIVVAKEAVLETVVGVANNKGGVF